MNSKMITKIMSEKGPVVEVVILKVDGSIKQKKLDMTPSLNQAAKTIDAKSVTLIGQLPASQVVIMKNRDSKGLKKNAHIHGKEANDVFNRFKEPDEDDEDATGEHKGDLLLVKMDDDAIPQSFTKENYLKYLSDFADGLLEEEDEEEEDEEIDEDEDEEDGDEEDEDEEEDEDDEEEEEDEEDDGDEEEDDDEQEEDDGELSPKVEKMLNLILAEYTRKYKKNPTLEKLHKFITEFVESETESEAEIIQYILDDIETDLNKESSKKREREDKKESKPKNQPAIQSKKSKKA